MEQREVISSLTKEKETAAEECKRATEAVADLEKKYEELES